MKTDRFLSAAEEELLDAAAYYKAAQKGSVRTS
jgi:hypothetical protein